MVPKLIALGFKHFTAAAAPFVPSAAVHAASLAVRARPLVVESETQSGGSAELQGGGGGGGGGGSAHPDWSAFVRQSTTPVPVELGKMLAGFKQELTSPTAYPPRAVTQLVNLGTMASPVSLLRAVQAAGTSFTQGHPAFKALERQASTSDPVLVGRMLEVDRHLATSPTALVPSAVTQVARFGTIAKPARLPSAEHAGGNVVTHTGGGVVTGHVLPPPPFASGSPSPKAFSKHCTMSVPEVSPPAKQVAALPTANGPRAVVH